MACGPTIDFDSADHAVGRWLGHPPAGVASCSPAPRCRHWFAVTYSPVSRPAIFRTSRADPSHADARRWRRTRHRPIVVPLAQDAEGELYVVDVGGTLRVRPHGGGRRAGRSPPNSDTGCVDAVAPCNQRPPGSVRAECSVSRWQCCKKPLAGAAESRRRLSRRHHSFPSRSLVKNFALGEQPSGTASPVHAPQQRRPGQVAPEVNARQDRSDA